LLIFQPLGGNRVGVDLHTACGCISGPSYVLPATDPMLLLGFAKIMEILFTMITEQRLPKKSYLG
jgi:hypothetical protein